MHGCPSPPFFDSRLFANSCDSYFLRPLSESDNSDRRLPPILYSNGMTADSSRKAAFCPHYYHSHWPGVMWLFACLLVLVLLVNMLEKGPSSLGIQREGAPLKQGDSTSAV